MEGPFGKQKIQSKNTFCTFQNGALDNTNFAYGKGVLLDFSF